MRNRSGRIQAVVQQDLLTLTQHNQHRLASHYRQRTTTHPKIHEITRSHPHHPPGRSRSGIYFILFVPFGTGADGPQELTPQQKEMGLTLMTATRLKPEYAKQLLEASGWSLEQAQQTFLAYQAQQKITPDMLQ